MLDRILATLAPHSCCGCGKLGAIMCPSCKNDIISEPFSRCIECLTPTATSNICFRCQNILGVEAAWCVGLREESLQRLLSLYKFSSVRDASTICVEMIDETIPVLPASTVIVPVPTAPAHVRVRGFDHVGRITGPFARARGLRHATILRRYGTATQHFKTKSQRLASAATGLEAVRRAPDTVLLVDDIYTTGATIKACVAALKGAGARQVFVAVIARQPLDENNDL